LREGGSGAIAPPAPRAEAHRVAGAALHADPTEATRTPLHRHPRAALHRRFTRAVLPAAVLVAGVWFLDTRAGVASLVLLLAAAWLAVDRYLSLGHALTARHLVTRLGGLRRRTVALQRDGVIGWTIRQSVFQRRAGVVTAEAVTAAGRGGYLVLDIAADDAVALADAVTPELLTPFLSDERRSRRTGSDEGAARQDVPAPS